MQLMFITDVPIHMVTGLYFIHVFRQFTLSFSFYVIILLIFLFITIAKF